MRELLCKILYKLGLYSLAYKASPSEYHFLLGRDFAESFVAGMNSIKSAMAGFTEALQEENRGE